MMDSTGEATLPFTLDGIADLVLDRLGAAYFLPSGELADTSLDDLVDDRRVIWLSSEGCPRQFAVVVAEFVPENRDVAYEATVEIRPAE